MEKKKNAFIPTLGNKDEISHWISLFQTSPPLELMLPCCLNDKKGYRFNSFPNEVLLIMSRKISFCYHAKKIFR